jgi:hypothetical protein
MALARTGLGQPGPLRMIEATRGNRGSRARLLRGSRAYCTTSEAHRRSRRSRNTVNSAAPSRSLPRRSTILPGFALSPHRSLSHLAATIVRACDGKAASPSRLQPSYDNQMVVVARSILLNLKPSPGYSGLPILRIMRTSRTHFEPGGSPCQRSLWRLTLCRSEPTFFSQDGSSGRCRSQSSLNRRSRYCRSNYRFGHGHLRSLR